MSVSLAPCASLSGTPMRAVITGPASSRSAACSLRRASSDFLRSWRTASASSLACVASFFAWEALWTASSFRSVSSLWESVSCWTTSTDRMRSSVRKRRSPALSPPVSDSMVSVPKRVTVWAYPPDWV